MVIDNLIHQDGPFPCSIWRKRHFERRFCSHLRSVTLAPRFAGGLSGGALTVSQFLDGGCWEGEIELFKGVAVFT